MTLRGRVAALSGRAIRNRRLVRAPIRLYQHGLGSLLGPRLLMLEHVGRSSGRPRFVVLEVVARPDRNTYVVASAFGEQAQWYRNVVAEPRVRVSSGLRRDVAARATPMPAAEAAATLADYQRRHPRVWQRLEDTIEAATGRPATGLPMVRLHLEPPDPAPVDVTTRTVIGRPRAEVADYAAEPANAPSWYLNIDSVRPRSAQPLAAGAEVDFRARFLGRRLDYTYRVEVWEPRRRLVMRTEHGPFPMETTYTWEDTPAGGTRMSLRNRGGPSGGPGLASAAVARLLARVMTPAVRRANRKDLDRLRQVLEGRRGPG